MDINEGSFQQAIVKAYDEAAEALKTVVSNPEDFLTSDLTDSIKIGDGTGTNFAGVTEVNSRSALNTLAIDATESVYIDEASSTVTYFGYAAAGGSTSSAVWKIKKLTVSGTVTSILFADGNSNYDNIWNNRASLSYS